jgi:GxxExxY protein
MMLVKHEQLTEHIIKGFYTVYRALGYGFLEKVYENSLAIQLRKMKLVLHHTDFDKLSF